MHQDIQFVGWLNFSPLIRLEIKIAFREVMTIGVVPAIHLRTVLARIFVLAILAVVDFVLILSFLATRLSVRWRLFVRYEPRQRLR